MDRDQQAELTAAIRRVAQVADQKKVPQEQRKTVRISLKKANNPKVNLTGLEYVEPPDVKRTRKAATIQDRGLVAQVKGLTTKVDRFLNPDPGDRGWKAMAGRAAKTGLGMIRDHAIETLFTLATSVVADEQGRRKRLRHVEVGRYGTTVTTDGSAGTVLFQQRICPAMAGASAMMSQRTETYAKWKFVGRNSPNIVFRHTPSAGALATGQIGMFWVPDPALTIEDTVSPAGVNALVREQAGVLFQVSAPATLEIPGMTEWLMRCQPEVMTNADARDCCYGTIIFVAMTDLADGTVGEFSIDCDYIAEEPRNVQLTPDSSSAECCYYSALVFDTTGYTLLAPSMIWNPPLKPSTVYENTKEIHISSVNPSWFSFDDGQWVFWAKNYLSVDSTVQAFGRENGTVQFVLEGSTDSGVTWTTHSNMYTFSVPPLGGVASAAVQVITQPGCTNLTIRPGWRPLFRLAVKASSMSGQSQIYKGAGSLWAVRIGGPKPESMNSVQGFGEPQEPGADPWPQEAK